MKRKTNARRKADRKARERRANPYPMSFNSFCRKWDIQRGREPQKNYGKPTLPRPS